MLRHSAQILQFHITLVWFLTDVLPSLLISLRDGKYIPLPQRAREREIGTSRGDRERGGPSSSLPNRTNRPAPSSSSPRPPLPSGSGQPTPPSDRNSPLSIRGGYSPHQAQCSPPAQPRPLEAGHASPPVPHMLPHSLSHPQSLSDSTRPVNGGNCLMASVIIL